MDFYIDDLDLVNEDDYGDILSELDDGHEEGLFVSSSPAALNVSDESELDDHPSDHDDVNAHHDADEVSDTDHSLDFNGWDDVQSVLSNESLPPAPQSPHSPSPSLVASDDDLGPPLSAQPQQQSPPRSADDAIARYTSTYGRQLSQSAIESQRQLSRLDAELYRRWNIPHLLSARGAPAIGSTSRAPSFAAVREALERDLDNLERGNRLDNLERENRRHHPYRGHPPPAVPGERSLADRLSWPRPRDLSRNDYSSRVPTPPFFIDRSHARSHASLSDSDDFEEPEEPSDFDELVEMEVAAPVPARRQNANANRANSGNIIDLTGDPSDASDEILILPPNHTHNHNRASNRRSIPPPLSRNPRRQMSLNHRTPSLARSDGSLLGPAAPVIDLTMDDEDSDGPPRPLNLPNQQRHPARAQGRARSGPPPRAPPRSAAAAHNAQIIGGDPEFGALIGIVRNLGQNFQRFRDFGAIGNFPFFGGQGLEPVGNNARAPFMNNPLGENLPRFNYGANGYNSGGLAKPRHEPPKPAREGFSRATGAELDYVCPSCDEELKYDPDADDANAPPAKKARTRKDREEHHFWAVKECGHVYCRSCYENRKPSAKSPTKTTFRVSPQHPKKLLCAVDDCESDVTTKAAWVGLFV